MRELIIRYKWVLVFNLLYIIPFTIYYLSRLDFEFLLYVGVLIFFLVFVITTLRKTHFDSVVLWGLSIWGLLHMLGGGVPVGDTVLYGLTLIPLYDGGGEFVLLKYDQVVHAFGFAVATIVVYQLLRQSWKTDGSKRVLYIVSALGGMGLGVINEIVEFTAVLLVPDTGVGGYVNTSLDLVFNTLGALCALVFIHYLYEREKSV